MLNRSTADEVQNDPVSSGANGGRDPWGYSGLLVVNLFAYRATTRPK
jgi:hypothetical protein